MTHGEPCVTMHGKGLCMCDTWQVMCVTHGMPCVNMHGTLRAINMGAQILFVWGAARRRRRKGKEKGRKGEEKGRKRKEEKKNEEERKRKECHAVSRPRRQRTRNCATRGRFPHTLVILCLGAT